MKRITYLLLALVLLLSACSGSPANEAEEASASSRTQPSVSTTVELTLATDDDDLGMVRALVYAFNESQDKYRINVNSYCFYSDSDKTPDLLRTEVIAGNAPDIFAFTYEHSLSEVKSKNAYIDLNEYLDRDDDLSRSDFVEPLIDAMSENGALHWLPGSFTISTFVAPESLFGSNNITLAEAEQAAASVGLPLLPEWMTKMNILTQTSMFALDKFIDRENGTCSFDSDEFIQLLKLCGEWDSTAPRQDDITSLSDDDKCLLTPETLGGIHQVSIISQYYSGDFRFVGLPTGDGNGSMFDVNPRFAISNRSEKKDAAWEFIKFAMSEEGRSRASLFFSPILSILNDEIDDALENGYDDGIEKVEVSAADVQKFWDLVGSIDIISSSNSAIIAIIYNEAGAYFAGDKTAEACAKLIQSRVSLYVAEQYG